MDEETAAMIKKYPTLRVPVENGVEVRVDSSFSLL
jgi:hypothetical protein